MDIITIEIVLCVLLPICLLCFFLDSKPRSLMMAFMSGVIACLCAYWVNTFIIDTTDMETEYFITTIAPMIEELVKYLPIIVLMKHEKNNIKSTAALAFAVGVGFCVVENLSYLVIYIETANIIWIIARSVGTGLMHSISATIIGIGLYFSYSEKHIRLLLNMSVYFFAVMYHGLFNILVQSEYFKVLAILIPVLSYLLVQAFLNKDELSKILLNEK